jgi:hypothetical protein
MIDKIKKYFTDRKERKRLEEETFFADTWALGFDKIEFPILIQEGYDLSIVGDKEHFFGDPDIYFFEYDSSMRLIDSHGLQFTWGYSSEQNSNYPDKLVGQLTVDEVREIANQYFKDAKTKPDIENVKTTKELINKIGDHLRE